MSRETVTSVEELCCTNCGIEMYEEGDSSLDDYVVPGQEGYESRADLDCWNCGAEHYVEKEEDGTFVLGEN